VGEADAPPAGAALERAATGGTAVLVVAALAAATAPDTFGVAYAALSCLLFAIGTGARQNPPAPNAGSHAAGAGSKDTDSAAGRAALRAAAHPAMTQPVA